MFERIFFIYFLCHRGLITKSENGINRKISGAAFFKLLLSTGDFVESLYRVFNRFNQENHTNSIEIHQNKFFIPFLNGGLFKISKEELQIHVGLKESEWTEVFDFLNSYHWIIEDETGEIEDEKILTPEILGHVYERSVVEWETKGFEEEVAEAAGKSERQSKGVYYTPEFVTEYICRRAIYEYFSPKVMNGSVERLLSEGTTEELSEFSKRLDEVKVLDPACGSGVFLIKTCEILFQLKSRLNARVGIASSHYDTKLSIITKNVYGLDVLQGASEIAKLRLWLWLISSYKEGLGVTPLPNIEYNIVVGDSLVGWLDQKLTIANFPILDEMEFIIERMKGSASDNRLYDTVRRLLASSEINNYILAYSTIYEAYKGSHGKNADTLRSILIEMRPRIYDRISRSLINSLNEGYSKTKVIPIGALGDQIFHWKFDFGIIIASGGFDIMVGNPPYERASILEGEKTYL